MMLDHDKLPAQIRYAVAQGRKSGIASAVALLRARALKVAQDAARIHASGQHIETAASMARSAALYTIAADAVQELAEKEPA